MANRSPDGGRPRGSDAAVPELQEADGLTLARWIAGATSGGISQRSAARLAGISVRHAQRLMDRHAADGFVSRDRLIGQALRWENKAAAALEEATSRATSWLREASNNAETDARTMAAALAATVGSAHRLGEIGARRARRLQPQQPERQSHFDAQAFLAAVATACSEIRQQLPADRQPEALEALHQQLKAEQQGQALEPIDVEALPVEAEPPACPF